MMLTWVNALARASAEVVAKVEALYARHEQGELTRDEFVAALVALLKVSGQQATALADEYTALQLGLQTGMEELVVPLGLERADAAEAAIEDEAEEALGSADVLAALTVLGRAYVLEAAQQGRQTALESQGVKYWRREVEPNACEVCTDLAEGIVPIEQAPWFHKGCGCGQEPVLDHDN